jgi:chromosome segregation ATPase
VLDHKIKELKKDIGPREREINEMKAKTNQMDKKLKEYNADNSGLAEFVSELFKNEESLKSDIAKQRSRISYQNVRIKQFKDAVYQAVQFIQNEERLKEEASELNRKFVTHSIKPVEMDGEIEQ